MDQIRTKFQLMINEVDRRHYQQIFLSGRNIQLTIRMDVVIKVESFHLR